MRKIWNGQIIKKSSFSVTIIILLSQLMLRVSAVDNTPPIIRDLGKAQYKGEWVRVVEITDSESGVNALEVRGNEDDVKWHENIKTYAYYDPWPSTWGSGGVSIRDFTTIIRQFAYWYDTPYPKKVIFYVPYVDPTKPVKFFVWSRNGDGFWTDWKQIGEAAVAVGGITLPIDKLSLLAPYIALAVAVIAVTVGSVYARKRWFRKALSQKP
jgi:hypothetical protein